MDVKRKIDTPSFECANLTQDLTNLELRLKKCGARAVENETSLNKLFQTHLNSGGSRTRAFLALAAGIKLALPDSVRLPIATSVELLHQASLIHDDIQDQDSIRRGSTAIWDLAGESTAICLGDNMIAAAFEQLAMLPEPYSYHLARLTIMLSRGVSTMAAGQALDCQWTPGSHLSLAQYEQIVRHKSGPLLGLPIAMTLLVNGGTDDQVTNILSGASSIGIAYQLADDLNDREDDYGQRLNGYWVIQENSGDQIDIESELRARFEWHLTNARESVANLSDVPAEAFEVLIEALHHKYPTFRKAAA
ncbi:polyprenyl synthetase family protein [Litorivicinus sp.]|nr:polyprenyl synthetase family protein [Litorivicinus sp.]MDC1239852.1 polyprenyl synthetase family protein [Litorivicinus sp.]